MNTLTFALTTQTVRSAHLLQKIFEGQAKELQGLVDTQCSQRFGAGTAQKRTSDTTATSFGPGRCLLLVKPLQRSNSVALVSTSIQRDGIGLSSRISYLFEGIRELATKLADNRISNQEVVMPLVGGGNAGIAAKIAFVSTLLAIAEMARYGHGSQRLKLVTIVVFKPDTTKPAAIDATFVREALALVTNSDK
jgi:hypothetical protein